MAGAACTLEQLGFRVIEGGKSNKLVLLTTRGVAEIFAKRHFHVLGDVREYQAKLPPNLVAAFTEHCRLTKYRGRDNTERDSYELTKIGFVAFALKYDEQLRFLLALAFDALERNDTTQKTIVTAQINARIRELRSRATGGEEFDFDALEVPTHAITALRADGESDDDRVDAKALREELSANERHLRVISDMGHSMAYDAEDESRVTQPTFMRDELPIGQNSALNQAGIGD